MSAPTWNEIDEYIGTADDGATFPIGRLGNSAGPPIVLLPGMCDNRRIYFTAVGGGLANHLAARGCNVWIAERRGTRGSTVPAGGRRGWNEAVQLDLPAVQRLVLEHTQRKAIWIGHSYGGVILSRALALRTLDHDRIMGNVLVGSAVDVPLMRSRALRRIARASVWTDPLPTHILGFGPEDEYRDQLEDMFEWCDLERDCGGVTAGLAAVTLPLLAMPGNRDVLSPPSACDRLARAYGSTDRQRIQIAKRNGFTSDIGHDTLLMNHRRPRTDVFNTIGDWIDAHTN